MASYEKYWLKVWNEKRVFESEPMRGKKKIFATFPYPYMNGPLHIGHCFTATRVDIYARFKRMQGYNVLFPWAWHWTGESIPGMSYRLSQGDESVRKAFLEMDGVTPKEVERFVDPEYLASYYTRVSREAVKETGFSIDWRREFRTVDPAYKKFIEWQYLRLRELGYVVQGTHPVVWCKRDLSPTGDHDRLEGEGVSAEEFNLIKFEMDEVPRRGDAQTRDHLRRDERLGAPGGVVRRRDRRRGDLGGQFVRGRATEGAAARRDGQAEFKGSELVGRVVKAPKTGAVLPVLPTTFVDTDIVTGVVYSVPAHAPYDLMGLRDIQTGRLGVPADVKEIADGIKPISIISVSGYSEIPAEDLVQKLGIRDADDPRLEEATAELYKAEFHRGVMKDNCGAFSRMKVSEAKTAIVAEMKGNGFTIMYELPEKVVCKCGTRCYVKILENQWFLNYSDPAWKELTREVITERQRLSPSSRWTGTSLP